MTNEATNAIDVRVDVLGAFWFLVDAPMFMDTPLIERFHDAVLRPEHIVVKENETTSAKEEKQRKIRIEAKGKGDIVPFVVGMALKGRFDSRFTRENAASLGRELSIPRTSERLVEEIVAFYLAYFPERVVIVDPVNGKVSHVVDERALDYSHLDAICNVPGPRPIILIEAPKGAKIMPMAGEFADGKVEVVYDELIQALSTSDEPMRRIDSELSVEKKAERWKELIGRFKAPVAMKVLEAAGKDHNGSRFEWIDFRMAWGEGGTPSPLHLHVCPRGQYSMGTFAHAFVRRGQSNGVRILGTLKTGGDINVLAIYER